MGTVDKLEPGFDRGYDGHQRRQARLGLALTPAARLAWLERRTAEIQRLLGRARAAGREADRRR
jgi:hypothetical protein